MALEKPIIKADVAQKTTFEYKPKEFGGEVSHVAQTFVSGDAFQSTDFKISDLIAQQAGISQLEDDAQQDKINNQVLERLSQVQEKAYKEGYDLGLIEGTEKAFLEEKAGFIEKMAAFGTLIKRIEDLKSQLLIDNEAALIKLVFETAKRIALRDIEGNREAILEMLQSVVGETQADEKVVVRLSSDDHYFLEGLQDKTGERIETLQRVKFVPDDKIKPGGCLIETEFGSVNATVEERVERVWQTLQSKIPQQSPGKKE